MSHERQAVTGSELEDLELPRLEAFLADRAPLLWSTLGRDELGVRAGLLARLAPRVLPSVAGLYLFGRLPQLHFSEWGVTCAAFAGTTLADPVVARADLDGSIEALLSGCEAFVAERTGSPSTDAERTRSGGSSDTSSREFEPALVREIVVNALVHRDLRKPSRVVLRLFSDRMEVWSPGGPPEGMADLEEVARDGGVSSPRNPLLAAAARRLGLGEQLGRGLVLLLQSTSDAGRVELRTTPRDVLVVLPSRWRRPPQLS